MNKEVNVVSDNNLSISICNTAISVLLQLNYIKQEDIPNVKMNIGYLFKKVDGVLEGLLRASFNDKNYYLAVQNGKMLIVELNENLYNDTINKMKELHPCLKEVNSLETEEQKNRRLKNNKFISDRGISIYEGLPNVNYVSLCKDLDSICKRAIACLLVIQIACDINSGGDYQESISYFKPLLEKFNVMDVLNSKEKRILDGTYSKQDCMDMDWAYEAYWSLCWALGLVDDISDSSKLCDCPMACNFVQSAMSFDDFKSKCKLRNLNEILDMQDLYFRYDWACNNARVDSNTSLGNVNPDNVTERRRGLDWLLSSAEDWYDMEMNT